MNSYYADDAEKRFPATHAIASIGRSPQLSNVIKYANSFIHSIPEFNLALVGLFTWLTPPGSYRATICRERELTLDHEHERRYALLTHPFIRKKGVE